MHYFPITEECRKAMLNDIGARGFLDLIKAVPDELKAPSLNIPPPLSEMEAVRLLQRLADKNGSSERLSLFAGAGAYEHFIPAAVNAISSRGEFATAYTPYQAEASQGTLEAIFQYQTMICELTGLDVSNASLYDGATAAAEACMLTTNATKRAEILVTATTHPEYREVIETYFKGTGRRMRTIPFLKNGELDKGALEANWNSNVGGLLIQSPNFFGRIENLEGLSDWVHARGGLLIVVAHPLALGYFRTPGEYGADIACGDLQPLGNPLIYGGPYAGYFTTAAALMRGIPGRICGETVDAEGARAFTLTLQAREQHIRRERASSNICTNQALVALRSAIYLALMGQQGMKRVAELNLENAQYLREQIRKCRNVAIPFEGPMFNEFVVRFRKSSDEILKQLSERGILGGVALSRWFPEQRNDILVCATETKSKEDLDRYVSSLKEIL